MKKDCLNSCSEDPDVKGTETEAQAEAKAKAESCSEDPDVKGTETLPDALCSCSYLLVAARIPM